MYCVITKQSLNINLFKLTYITIFMNKGMSAGVILFIIGFLTTVLHPIITKGETGLVYGLYLMGIGALIIIILLIFERVKDNKQFKKEFKKEDLRP